jgi:hypothetical protein
MSDTDQIVKENLFEAFKKLNQYVVLGSVHPRRRLH